MATWDFGDGSQPVSFSVERSYDAGVAHSYFGTAGTEYIARLTLRDVATGESSFADYRVFLREKSLELELEIAVDEALWYLHKAMHADVKQVNAWNLLAFESQGFLASGDTANPYTETVSLALNQLIASTDAANRDGTFYEAMALSGASEAGAILAKADPVRAAARRRLGWTGKQDIVSRLRALSAEGTGRPDAEWVRLESQLRDQNNLDLSSASLYELSQALRNHVSNGELRPLTTIQSETQGEFDWLYAETANGAPADGVARILLGRQAADGSFEGEAEATAKAILTLRTAGVGSVTNVTAQTSSSNTAWVYNRALARYTSTLSLTNIGGVPISGPINVGILNLPASATLTNATGTFNTAPYINIPGVTTWNAGASITVQLQATIVPAAQITFGKVVYAGVFPPSALSVTCPATTATVGVPYSSALDANGGSMAYTYSISPGSLPSPLILSSTTGAITGTPTSTGTSNFTANVTDSAGPVAQTANASCSIVVNPAVNNPPTANGQTVGTLEDNAVTISLTGSDPESAPLTFAIVTPPGQGSLGSITQLTPTSASVQYTPNFNANGADSFTFKVNDGTQDSTSPATVNINITAVNDVPSFTKGSDQTVLEDAGPQTVGGWATAISPGPANESGQTVQFLVTGNTNPSLFSAGPAVSAAGTLTYTPAANANGSATITIVLMDNGGTANGGVDTSASQSFVINVTPVNDAPTFTKGADQTVLEDSGPQTVAGWATGMSPGPADESSQTLSFSITGNTNAALFSAGPAVSNTGTLTYTPAADAFGSATITVTLTDNGGTANGGVDSSSQTFVINVTGINDGPSFTKGADQTVNEDAGAQTVAGWATAISAGPNESSQTVNFIVSNNNNTLFSVQPAISATGTLTYTPAANQNGSATVTVQIHDNGGTANGGVDTSAAQTFTITVNAVNDPPVATAKNYSSMANMPIDIPAGTGLLPGTTDVDDGINGCTSTTFTVSSVSATNPSGGSVVANPDGSFRFNPPPGVTGNVTFTYTVNDTGCPAPAATSAPATVTFTLTGPVIWFVDGVSGGTGTLGSPFSSFSSAVTAMGSSTNQRIFIANANNQGSGTGVTLPANGWLVGQGVTGASFDAVMGISPPVGTIARPSIGLGRPTVQGTVNLNGANNHVLGLNISTSAAKGLARSNGGTINGLVVSDIGSITAVNARAVDLSDVGITFSAVAINSSGSDIGINLVNQTGSFTVTGSGGSCTASTPTCSGGTISNKSDSGIKLSNVNNVSFTRLRVGGTNSNFGLSGSTVNNMTIDNSLFDGTAGNAVDEGQIFVTNWFGSGTISNSEITGGFNDNVRVDNRTTGTLNRLTVSNSTIRNSGNNHGLAFYGCLNPTSASDCPGLGTMNLTVSNSTFLDNSANSVNVSLATSAVGDIVLNNNTFQSTSIPAVGGTDGSVLLSINHSARMTFDVDTNSFQRPRVTAFNLFAANGTSSTASFVGKVRNNTIGTSGSTLSGSRQGSGMALTATGSATMTVNVTNNTIRNWATNNGMDLSAGDGGTTGPQVNLTVSGNTLHLDSPDINSHLHGISSVMGTTSAGGQVNACVDIGGQGSNTVTGSSIGSVNGAFEIRYRQRFSSTVRMPNYPGGGASNAITTLANQNVATAPESSNISVDMSGSGSFSGGGPCTQAP